MKTKNFPQKKLARQYRALERMCSKAHPTPSEMINDISDARGIRTKKRRTQQ